MNHEQAAALQALARNLTALAEVVSSIAKRSGSGYFEL
jgi:hypothetical protein